MKGLQSGKNDRRRMFAFKISSKCYDEEIEVAGQAAAHAKIKPKKDMSIGVYSAS